MTDREPTGNVGTPLPNRTHLYRHFAADGTLLYVGISLSALGRLQAHRASAWSEDIARVEVETYPTRAAALAAEKAAIKSERPKHNRVHATRPKGPAVPTAFDLSYNQDGTGVLGMRLTDLEDARFEVYFSGDGTVGIYPLGCQYLELSVGMLRELAKHADAAAKHYDRLYEYPELVEELPDFGAHGGIGELPAPGLDARPSTPPPDFIGG